MSSSDAYFRTRFTDDPRRAAVWRHIVRRLGAYVPAESAVLELGAGYCHFINHVAARRRVAVDLSPELPQRADAGVETHVGDALAFLGTCERASFDFVFASNFFEHLDWPALDAIIPLVVRCLRPGGRLGVLQPNFRTAPRRYFDDFTHRTVFTDVSLHDWLEASGLHVTHLEPRFLPLTVKSPAGRFAFLVPLYWQLPFRPFAGQMLAIAERPLERP